MRTVASFAKVTRPTQVAPWKLPFSESRWVTRRPPSTAAMSRWKRETRGSVSTEIGAHIATDDEAAAVELGVGAGIGASDDANAVERRDGHVGTMPATARGRD